MLVAPLAAQAGSSSAHSHPLLPDNGEFPHAAVSRRPGPPQSTQSIREDTLFNGQSGPNCLIARFPKAGGTSVTDIVGASWLNRAEPHVFTLREYGGLRRDHFSPSSFVIGQTRHPLDWYASLWAYLSDKHRGRSTFKPVHGFMGDGKHLKPLLASATPRGATADDVKRFRAFVRLFTTPKIGAFSLHFWASYIDGVSGSLDRKIDCSDRDDANSTNTCIRLKHQPQKHAAMLHDAARQIEAFVHRHRRFARRHRRLTGLPPNETPQGAESSQGVGRNNHEVDCWVRQEDLSGSLKGCLADCERALKTKMVDWKALQASCDTVSNPSTERVANAVLYDDATRQLVATADRQLLAFFGYSANDTDAGDRRARPPAAKQAATPKPITKQPEKRMARRSAQKAERAKQKAKQQNQQQQKEAAKAKKLSCKSLVPAATNAWCVAICGASKGLACPRGMCKCHGGDDALPPPQEQRKWLLQIAQDAADGSAQAEAAARIIAGVVPREGPLNRG